MNQRNRAGLALLLLAICWLMAAPHSGASGILAIASIVGQIVGTIYLVFGTGTPKEKP